jgi:hypothetical protein
MKSLFLAALLAVAANRRIQTKELQYDFCEGAGRPFTIDEMVVEPYPIVIQAGAILNVAIGLILNEPIPTGASLRLEIVKDLLIDFPFPCISYEEMHLGSW